MDYSKLAIELAAHVRNVVRPLVGRAEYRKVTGIASSGDATFHLDNAAEDAVVRFIEENGLNVAYYTEDAGLRKFGNPEATLIIDPIDGTRGAIAGFECCVVSVAVADYGESVKMRNVRAGCVYEIKEDRAFVAERGCGVSVFDNGIRRPPAILSIRDIESAPWSAEIVARPANRIVQVLGDLIDKSSLRGGFFILNSTAFSLTRLISGQLAAVVDIGGRLVKEIPGTREEFIRCGGGKVIGLFPYDIAAAAMIAQEAGCVVTNAYGDSLDDIDLLNASESNIQTILAACTPQLHERFLEAINCNFGI